MKYYKVTNTKLFNAGGGRYCRDNVFSFRLDKHGRRIACQYIADELLTAAELRKDYGITPENMRLFPFLCPVSVNRNKTHFFFGARFEDGTPLYYDKDGTPRG